MVFRGTFPAGELTPAPCGLLGVADVTRHTGGSVDERWLRGFSVEFESAPKRVTIIDSAGTETLVYENEDESITYSDVAPFVIEVEDKASGVNLVGDRPLERAERQLEAVTQKSVEYELWEGPAATYQPNQKPAPYLAQKDGATVVTSGGVSVARALALLEQAIADSPTGGGGVIHMTRDVASTITNGGLSYKEGPDGSQSIITSLGTPVVVGSGYTGAGPEDAANAAPTATNKWMYVTGPVVVHLGPARAVNETQAQGFNPRTNDLLLKAQRDAAVHFDDSVFAAAQVTLPSS